MIDPSKRRAYRVFHTSNFYLFVVLLAADRRSRRPDVHLALSRSRSAVVTARGSCCATPTRSP